MKEWPSIKTGVTAYYRQGNNVNENRYLPESSCSYRAEGNMFSFRDTDGTRAEGRRANCSREMSFILNSQHAAPQFKYSRRSPHDNGSLVNPLSSRFCFSKWKFKLAKLRLSVHSYG